MNTNRKSLFHNLTTTNAPLVGVGGVRPNQLATSLFHFVCQHLGEHPQLCLIQEQREMSVGVLVKLVGADHLVLVFPYFIVGLGRTYAVMADAPIIEQLYHNMSGLSYEKLSSE